MLCSFELFRLLLTFMYLIGKVDPRPVPEADLEFAQSCIENFAQKLLRLKPGSKFAQSFHFILHAVRFCRWLRCHYGFLAVWMYENETRYLKRFLNSGNCKAEQFRNRVLEADLYMLNRDEASGRILRNEFGEPTTGWGGIGVRASVTPQVFAQFRGKYKKVVFRGFTISTKLADSFCIVRSPVRLRGGRHVIFQVTDMQVDASDGRIFLFGYVFLKKTALYDSPENSKSHNVFAFSSRASTMSAFPVESVVSKLFALPRFAMMEDAMREMKKSDVQVGKNFEHVEHWVGTTLHHLSVTMTSDVEMNTFY